MQTHHDEEEDDYTKLCNACIDNDEKEVTRLLDSGIYVDCPPTYLPYHELYTSPLHCAINYGFMNIVKILVSRGANVNREDPSELDGTPLHMAISRDHLEMVQFLLQNGSDMSIPDIHEHTCLEHAIRLAEWAKENDYENSPNIYAIISVLEEYENFQEDVKEPEYG